MPDRLERMKRASEAAAAHAASAADHLRQAASPDHQVESLERCPDGCVCGGVGTCEACLERTKRWPALICKACGGISDGPVEAPGVCTCDIPDNQPCEVVEVIPASEATRLTSQITRLEADLAATEAENTRYREALESIGGTTWRGHRCPGSTCSDPVCIARSALHPDKEEAQ